MRQRDGVIKIETKEILDYDGLDLDGDSSSLLRLLRGTSSSESLASLSERPRLLLLVGDPFSEAFFARFWYLMSSNSTAESTVSKELEHR